MTVKKIKDNTKAVQDALKTQLLSRAVLAGGLVLETAVKLSMSAASHSGRVYGKHKASAPGETPAVDTGNLVNSINTTLDRASATEAWANVGPTVEYGAYLEFGTSKMAARPFMRPGLDSSEDKIRDTIKTFLKQAIDGAAR